MMLFGHSGAMGSLSAWPYAVSYHTTSRKAGHPFSQERICLSVSPVFARAQRATGNSKEGARPQWVSGLRDKGERVGAAGNDCVHEIEPVGAASRGNSEFAHAS